MAKEEALYKDERLEIKIDPKEPQGHILIMKGCDHPFYFPRATLRDIALQEIPRAKNSLKQLFAYHDFYEAESNYIIAAATKAYYIDEERIRLGAEEW